MEWEWPVWRLVVDKGIPLTEILKWDMEDLDKATAILEMRLDYEMALRSKHEQEVQK